MATPVVMPKLGNTVESSIIVSWRKKPGETIALGETICEIETDKATIEVESPTDGIVLELFFGAGDDVPVLTNIAAIGSAGEDITNLRPGAATTATAPAVSNGAPVSVSASAVAQAESPRTVPPARGSTDAASGVSPRARNLAAQKGLELDGLRGSGPGGRIIERDVLAALAAQPRMTPLARTMVAKGEFVAPSAGTGIGGRITSRDLQPAGASVVASQPSVEQGPAAPADETQVLPLKGMRKLIAARMLNSMQTTAQLTLNAFADARSLQAYRQQLKASAENLGLQKITINDLLLYAVARTLPDFPDLNALFSDETITQYRPVHLGFAVDTPRGLMVPVIRNANRLSLRLVALESKRLADACLAGKILPDELGGGTFTVTNLGNLGIETFTPVLNPPQVGILGVGNIHLKAVEVDGAVQFIPHLGLSLTINHQVVDGAPGARFLAALAKNLAQFQLLLAV